jgi:hypothetical protein
MAQLDDKILRFKVDLQKKANAAKLAAKNALSLDITKSTEAKNAAAASDQSKPPIEQYILNTIDKVNKAAEGGEYYTVIELTPANRSVIKKYFKSKQYILIESRKLNVLIIAWMGGKKWRRYNLGTEQIRPNTASKVLEEYTNLLNNEWKKNKKKDKPDWEWINPGFGKKTIDTNKLLQQVNKF